MLRQDYVLRLIEKAAHALAKALAHVRGQELDEAQDCIAKAYEALLRVDRNMLEKLDARTLAPLLGRAEVVRVVAQIMAAEAKLHEHRGDPERARKLRRRASELYVAVGVGQEQADQAAFLSLYDALRKG